MCGGLGERLGGLNALLASMRSRVHFLQNMCEKSWAWRHVLVIPVLRFGVTARSLGLSSHLA